MLLASARMTDDIDQRLRSYCESIKTRTKSNRNSEAVDAESFFKNLLNLLYDFNLTRDGIENPYHETIDFHNTENKISLQVTAENTKKKVNKTIKSFKDGSKYEDYNELHFMFLVSNVGFSFNMNALSEYNVKIVFHDLTSIYQRMKDRFDSPEKIEPIYNFVRKELDADYNTDIASNSLYTEGIEEDEISKLKELHIVDQIYEVLNRFEGFAAIYPRTLARIYPFCLSGEYHYNYNHYCLKTDNIEIHQLLEKVSITSDKKVTVTDEALEPYRDKLTQIFEILNISLIRCICYREKYVDKVHHNINIGKYDSNCQCNSCKYHKFQIKSLFDELKLKTISPSTEIQTAINEAYYLCKIGEHIKAWQIFDGLLKNPESQSHVHRFIILYNLKRIRNFIDSPWWDKERTEIVPKIDSIDLFGELVQMKPKTLIRDELIKIQEKYHLHLASELVEDHKLDIEKNYHLYKRGGSSSGLPSVSKIWEELHVLWHFYIHNSIIADDFSDFEKIVRKGLEGLFISYVTDSRSKNRYKEFDNFILRLMIFFVPEEQLVSLMRKYEVSEIEILTIDTPQFIETCKNFFEFQVVKSFGTVKYWDGLEGQEYFSHYRQNTRHYFNRIMLILSKISIEDAKIKSLSQPIIDYFSGIEDLNYGNWEYFIKFLEKRIQIFDSKQIHVLIDLIFDKFHNRIDSYTVFKICDLARYKAGFELGTEKDTNFLIELTSSMCRKCKRVHNLELILSVYIIANDEGKKKIKEKSIEILNSNFKADFYEQAVFLEIFSKNEHLEFLNQFVDALVKNSSPNDFKFEEGMWMANHYATYNSLVCLSNMGFDFNDERLQQIANKSDYYDWLINTEKFNYSNFKTEWLESHCPTYVGKKLIHIPAVKKIVEQSLKDSYSEKLAKFYTKYLIPSVK